MALRYWSVAAAFAVLPFANVHSAGSDFPNRPIRIITLPPGSGTDFEGRLIAAAISGPLGQPVIIEGRANVIGAETVARAQPDGHTMLNTGASMWTAPLLQKMSYDPVKDFSPISMVSSEPVVLAVPASLGVKTIKDLVALAKAKPGQLNYSATGTGGSSHIANELFKSLAGVNIVRVSYKNQGAAIADMVGSDGKAIHVAFFSPGTVAPHVKSGRVIAIAVSSREPSALAPGLPTMVQAGLPGYEYTSINGLFAPAKTPTAIINRLNEEVVRYLASPAAKEKFLSNGAEATGSTPKELSAAMRAFTEKVAKIISSIKESGTIAN